jgi:hypothetical protein
MPSPLHLPFAKPAAFQSELIDILLVSPNPSHHMLMDDGLFGKSRMALSERESTIETVVIPGELKLNNPVPPPMTMPLPIVAWPNEVKNAWLGILFLLNGMMFLPLAVMIPELLVDAVSGADNFFLSPRGGFVLLILLFAFPFVLFFGIGYAGAALTCFWDAVRNDAVLEINAEGLRDNRSGLSVPWSSVRSARLLASRVAVDLQFHGPVTNWQNPFRFGVLFQRRRLPDHVLVSVGCLDAPAHILAYTILTLTQRNGGEVISKLPSGLEMYPRLLPQRRPLSAARGTG